MNTVSTSVQSSRTLRLGATGSLVLAAASGASAVNVTNGTVVYNDTPGISATSSSTSASFDVDGGGSTDFTISAMSGKAAKPPSKFKPSGKPGKPAKGYFGTSGSYSFLSTALAEGATVGPGTTFYGPTNVFLSSGEGFYGFSMTEGSTIYGWMKVSFSAPTIYTPSVQVLAWAYDFSGASINVGATASAIPEPAATTATMAGAALLAGSVVAWRRRKARAAVAA